MSYKTRNHKKKLTTKKTKQRELRSCKTKKYQSIYGVNRSRRITRSLFF
jgi:hypothetical protein